ncbi:MAG: hypothetical protein ACYTF7_07585, partial [Planctomycetota bacterium]
DNMLVVDVLENSPSGQFRVSVPRLLFKTPPNLDIDQLAPDGEHFFGVFIDDDESDLQSINQTIYVTLNVHEELNRLAPAQ